ncbi:GNAT family N-acetyltransferase [Nocardioides currus]|uniref:GNAT family N-acetyltransferase n=1 Tax=Nocardioides currus TaxID=2133958 RepID=A0A2R7YTN1_9ACTN|nr:GNAT family N-acetyltransferase [Nocardioides currus]PUA79745.1 GNAT family N-acetyltransferase [Nocardioides currus]
MDIRSLGFRTDLRLLEMTGSEIEDRGTHLVIRTPANPTYFWGNFLLLRQRPVPGGEREVIGAFRTEFPQAEHVSIGIDGTDDQTDLLQGFVDAGMEVDCGTVLTTGELVEPRPVAEGVVIRALESDDDWEGRAVLSRHLWSQTDEDTFMTYARRKNEQERALVAQGVGQRFGAFVDDTLVSTAGIFVTHAGLARYQSVETHPDHRRQGLAAAVVHAAGAHALATYGLETLVIAADTDGDAIRIYRSLGFTDAERHCTLELRPDAWA